MGVPVEFMGDSPGNRPRARVESPVMEKFDIRMELAGYILPEILPAFLRPDAALPVKPGNSPGKRMRIRGIPREKAAMRRHVPGKLPGEFRRYASAGNSPNFPAGAPYFPGNAASDAFRGKLDWQPWHFPGNSREIAARQPDSPPSSYSARWAARCNRRHCNLTGAQRGVRIPRKGSARLRPFPTYRVFCSMRVLRRLLLSRLLIRLD